MSRRPAAWAALLAALAVLMLLIQLAGAPVQEALAFRRSALPQGEWWRLLTAHFVHLGWVHLWLNLAGLGLVSLLLAEAPPSAPRLAALLLILSLAVGLGLLVGNPELERYVGLSGVLHGLAVVAAGRLLWRGRPGVPALLLAGLLAKLAHEQLSGADPTISARIGGEVITASHLYGALAGLALLAAVAARRLQRGR